MFTSTGSEISGLTEELCVKYIIGLSANGIILTKGGRFKYGVERMLSPWNTYMLLCCYTS